MNEKERKNLANSSTSWIIPSLPNKSYDWFVYVFCTSLTWILIGFFACFLSVFEASQSSKGSLSALPALYPTGQLPTVMVIRFKRLLYLSSSHSQTYVAWETMGGRREVNIWRKFPQKIRYYMQLHMHFILTFKLKILFVYMVYN